MTVRYAGTGGIRSQYECVGRWEHGNKATCSSVPADLLDQAVSEKILSIMEPSGLELSLKVMHSICEADRMSDKQWLLSIERAQYEADRAEKQFMFADPENRLVVRSLETNWNQKLKELEKSNRIMPYTARKNPGFLPKRKNRLSWILPIKSRIYGMLHLLRQKRKNALSVS